MGFEVPPTRVVSRRTRWPALLGPLVAILLAGVGYFSRSAPDEKPAPTAPAIAFATARPTASPVPSASSSAVPGAGQPSSGPSLTPPPGLGPLIAYPARGGPLAGVLTAPSASGQSGQGQGRPARSTDRGPTTALRLPAGIVCHGVDLASCDAMASAAVGILPTTWPAAQGAAVWHSLLCDSTLDCPPTLMRAVVPLGSVILDLADGGRPIWVDVVGWRTLAGITPALQLEAWIVGQ